MVATSGGSAEETPRSRAATAARTASGAGVEETDTRAGTARAEAGASVEAMRQAGTGGVGSAVVALVTAKWVTRESNPVEKDPTSRPTHAKRVKRSRVRGRRPRPRGVAGPEKLRPWPGRREAASRARSSVNGLPR